MSRRNPPAKWPLPLVVVPQKWICVQVMVPDEPYHRSAFLGALLDLASAYKWADDPAHTARSVALVWRDIVDNLKICSDLPDAGRGIALEDFMSTQIRISPDDPCIIQMWCIDHWENWYDPRSCIVGGVSQPPPSEPPVSGGCREYFVTLNGRDRWLLPFTVDAGNTIQISEATGGWNDGTITWACPSGGVYGLGICGAPLAPVGGDPIPTIAHMRLIGDLDNGTQWFDAYAGVYTVPAGFSNAAVAFQANDATLADNQGSVTFKVTVCNTELATWEKHWNFADESGPWYPQVVGGDTLGSYVPGTGWVARDNGTNVSLSILLNCPPGRYTHLEASTVSTTASGNYSSSIDGTTMWPATNPITSVYTWDGAEVDPGLINLNPSGIPTGSTVRVIDVLLRGTGPSPF